MDSDYEIVPYQPEFRQRLIELQRNLWSPSPDLNSAYFEWKYERNPYISAPLIYLALYRGAMVGMRGFSGVKWEAGSPPETLTGLYADDLVIAPDHRNRGLIPRIMRAAFEDLARQGHEYLFSLSAGPVTYLSSLATGWRVAGFGRPMCSGSWLWRRLVRMRGPLAVARRFRHAFPGKVNRAFRSLAHADPGAVTQALVDSPGISFAFEPPLDALTSLLARIGFDGRIRHVRDRAYLEWRFRNPLSRYGFLLHDGGREGYLVLQEYTSAYADPTRLNVVDWEATSAPVLGRLLDAARRIGGHRKQLYIWSATLSHEKLALLAKSGFRVDEEEGAGCHMNSVLVRSIVAQRPPADWLLAGKRLTNLADWDVRMLYSMNG